MCKRSVHISRFIAFLEFNFATHFRFFFGGGGCLSLGDMYGEGSGVALETQAHDWFVFYFLTQYHFFFFFFFFVNKIWFTTPHLGITCTKSLKKTASNPPITKIPGAKKDMTFKLSNHKKKVWNYKKKFIEKKKKLFPRRRKMNA